MPELSVSNPKIPAFLRMVTVVECAVVATAAFVLFVLPALGNQTWAWAIPPYNSRYVGVIYFAALLPLVIFAIMGRWAPGRVILWMIFTFTGTIGVVMFFHISSFQWTRFATYVFWVLYLFLPLNSAYFLYRLRRLPLAGQEAAPAPWRAFLVTLTLLLGLYGVGLLLAPEAVTAFWPWKIDAFHGHIYAATFITPAVGALIMCRRSARSERLTLGATLITLGILSVIGVIWASATVPAARKVNYASLGVWAFFCMNLLLTAAGAALAWSARLFKDRTLPTTSAA